MHLPTNFYGYNVFYIATKSTKILSLIAWAVIVMHAFKLKLLHLYKLLAARARKLRKEREVGNDQKVSER